MLTVTSISTPTFAPPKLHTSQKSSLLYRYTDYGILIHPDQNISMQFYELNFLPVMAGYYQFLGMGKMHLVCPPASDASVSSNVST